MAGDPVHSGSSYSPSMGMIYVFNLIVGTGALTLPAAFASAGWLISLFVILILALVSYLTMTFVVEAMATANCLLQARRSQQMHKKEEEQLFEEAMAEDSDSSASSPTRSLLRDEIKVRKKSPSHSPAINRPRRSYQSLARLPVESENVLDGSTNILVNVSGAVEEEECDFRETVEMSKLAGMFFSPTETVLFFLCIAVYLYGDLAIYGAAVGKSLRDTACTYHPPDVPCNATLDGTIRCWEGYDLSRDNAYRLFLSVFVMTIGAFGFFNVQKTMLLQILTSVVRWTAFVAMIVLACIRLASSAPGDLIRPPAVRMDGLPNLFGACVYSFMCHHSLPSLVTPIQPKRGLYRFLAADYLLIAAFYLLLGLTGVFAFYPHLADLYTLNFVPDRCPSARNGSMMGTNNEASVLVLAIMPLEAVRVGQQVLFYFLTLFPVFTLSTSFPIITITLRNNLKQLFLRRPEAEYGFFVRRLLFPLLALIPPTIVAVATSDVSLLVGITGSYAGAAVQYVVPAHLAYRSRAELAKERPDQVVEPASTSDRSNAFSSPFRRPVYVWLTHAWAAACVVFVTYNHVAGR